MLKTTQIFKLYRSNVLPIQVRERVGQTRNYELPVPRLHARFGAVDRVERHDKTLQARTVQRQAVDRLPLQIKFVPKIKSD